MRTNALLAPVVVSAALAGACTGVLSDPVIDPARNEDARYVFVSRTTYIGGALGGLEGGDGICAALASAARLPGATYKAWLSDNTTSAATRLEHATVPYKLIDGTSIAMGWADLADGALQHAIDHDEHGRLVHEAPAYVWTGTDDDGSTVAPNKDLQQPDENCGGWSAYRWGAGGVFEAGERWTNSVVIPCEEEARLYCVEQGP